MQMRKNLRLWPFTTKKPQTNSFSSLPVEIQQLIALGGYLDSKSIISLIIASKIIRHNTRPFTISKKLLKKNINLYKKELKEIKFHQQFLSGMTFIVSPLMLKMLYNIFKYLCNQNLIKQTLQKINQSKESMDQLIYSDHEAYFWGAYRDSIFADRDYCTETITEVAKKICNLKLEIKQLEEELTSIQSNYYFNPAMLFALAVAAFYLLIIRFKITPDKQTLNHSHLLFQPNVYKQTNIETQEVKETRELKF